jgi:hypothetical protein
MSSCRSSGTPAAAKRGAHSRLVGVRQPAAGGLADAAGGLLHHVERHHAGHGDERRRGGADAIRVVDAVLEREHRRPGRERGGELGGGGGGGRALDREERQLRPRRIPEPLADREPLRPEGRAPAVQIRDGQTLSPEHLGDPGARHEVHRHPAARQHAAHVQPDRAGAVHQDLRGRHQRSPRFVIRGTWPSRAQTRKVSIWLEDGAGLG